MSRSGLGWRLWDRHHTKAGWAMLGLLIGGVIGMSVGSYASCSDAPAGCQVHWDAVEAIGTWFGAVGGLLAVGAAIATFRSGEQARLDEQHRSQNERDARRAAEQATAERVNLHWSIARQHGLDVTHVHLVARNDNTDVIVYSPTAMAPTLGRSVGTRAVKPASEEKSGPAALPQPADFYDATWLPALAAETTFTYVIDNVQWKRVGTAAPERV